MRLPFLALRALTPQLVQAQPTDSHARDAAYAALRALPAAAVIGPRSLLGVLLIGLLAGSAPAKAQHYQSDFPPEEWKARWEAVLEKIGNEAVAVVQGMPLTNGFQLPRQSNSLYYLSGIETPHAYLRLDGRSRSVTIYLPPRNERLERSEGKVLSAADAELVKRLTGRLPGVGAHRVGPRPGAAARTHSRNSAIACTVRSARSDRIASKPCWA